MSSINQLGFGYNLTASVTTAAIRVSLRDCSGVGFYIVGASTALTATITEANAASGGTSQTLAGTFPYWTQAAGTSVWTAGAGGVNGTSINTIANAAATLFVFVPQGALSDGFSYLACSHGTGTIAYILDDLNIGRRATNLQNARA